MAVINYDDLLYEIHTMNKDYTRRFFVFVLFIDHSLMNQIESKSIQFISSWVLKLVLATSIGENYRNFTLNHINLNIWSFLFIKILIRIIYSPEIIYLPYAAQEIKMMNRRCLFKNPSNIPSNILLNTPNSIFIFGILTPWMIMKFEFHLFSKWIFTFGNCWVSI